MNIKSKAKKILCITLIIISLLALSTGVVSAAHIYQPPEKIDGANVADGPNKGEIFKEYRSELNWAEVPVWLFEQWGKSFWCVQHGTPIRDYLTATEPHYWAWYYKRPEGVAAYDENEPYYFYRRTEKMGLIEDHQDKWNEAKSKFESAAKNNGWTSWGMEAYDKRYDDQWAIDVNNMLMPSDGFAKDPVYSIEWNYQYDLVNEENQDALFVVTQQKVYKTAADVPANDTLSMDERKNAYFTVVEKQNAYWKLPINRINGGAMINEDSEADAYLGNIALEYQKFYDKIHSTPKGYEDIVEAYNVNKETGMIKGSDDIEEKRTVIDGEDLKMYEYKDTGVEIDTASGCYILGPYCIDYAVNDDAKDIFYAIRNGQKDCEVKYNAIENITVYNQDKIDITKLGGYFKIAYKYPIQRQEDEGKTLRINDSYYWAMADGEEISGFTSKDPFYIVVYRGSMKPEQFQGMYAKIDFRYLESINGTIQQYYGDVYKYYYSRKQGLEFPYSVSGWWEKVETVNGKTVTSSGTMTARTLQNTNLDLSIT